MIEVKNITKSYGDRLLFGDVSFTLNDGDKVALVARNGTGKTTLLRILAGEESPDSGEVVFSDGLRIGWLPQSPVFDPELSVVDACMSAGSVSSAARTAADYLVALDSGDTDAIHHATAAMDAAGAWDYEDRLRRMLTSLDIHDLSAKVGTLSGGQLKRVALASVLLDAPDVLILDEPTNHLDIPTIEWLEKRLSRERVTLLLVTHDRYFLDRTCNTIIELDHRSVFVHRGNFDNYLRRRTERLEAMAADVARAKNLLRKETEWMRRQPQARGTKAQYRIDAYHQLTGRAKAERAAKDLNLDRNGKTYIGSKIFEAEGVTKSFGDLCVLRDFSYIFARREKVGIIGPNGVGKSTFIKMLLGLVAPDSGSFDIGETVHFGYYSQGSIEFDSHKRVIDAVTEFAETVAMPNGSSLSPMQFLTRFLFEPADQQKYIHTLSGGEKARLHLATVLMRNPNFLILDEPTNDLDIMTLGVLERYLSEFDGCVIVISHDRFFLDSIVDHLFVFSPGGNVGDFPGNYSDWRAWDEQRRAAEAAASAPVSTAQSKPRQAHAPKLSYKERKELERLTIEIDELTAEKAQLDARFASGETLDNTEAMAIRYAELTSLLDDKEMRWLELSEMDQ